MTMGPSVVVVRRATVGVSAVFVFMQAWSAPARAQDDNTAGELAAVVVDEDRASQEEIAADACRSLETMIRFTEAAGS